MAASITCGRQVGRRLLRLRICDKLDREHRAEPADIADLRPPSLPGFHPRPDRLADVVRPLDQALVVDHVEHGEGGGDRDRVADERSTDGTLVRRVHDLGLPEHARQRQPHGDRLRDGDQVRLDAGVLDREEATRAREPGLHLVDDEHDAVAVADLAQTLHELRWRGHEAALALHRLDDDRRDVLRGNQRRERALEGSERLGGGGAAIGVRERHPVDLGRERAEPELVGMRLRGERQRQQRATVERTLEGDHRRTAGVEPRKLDGVLDRLGCPR